MRPKLKIGPLTHLQDARSSAAVGFDLISFSLERGSTRKLAPSLVWNIINWIQGPEVVLELNAASLDELAETNKMFPAQVVSFPLSEWKPEFLDDLQASLYFKANSTHTPEQITKALADVEAKGQTALVEVRLEEISKIGTYKPFYDKLFLHFAQAELLTEFLQSGAPIPYGFALGDEFREDVEYLDYERIDDLMELLEDRFPIE